MWRAYRSKGQVSDDLGGLSKNAGRTRASLTLFRAARDTWGGAMGEKRGSRGWEGSD